MTKLGKKVKENMEWVKKTYPRFLKDFGEAKARDLMRYDQILHRIEANMTLEEIEKFFEEIDKKKNKP